MVQYWQNFPRDQRPDTNQRTRHSQALLQLSQILWLHVPLSQYGKWFGVFPHRQQVHRLFTWDRRQRGFPQRTHARVQVSAPPVAAGLVTSTPSYGSFAEIPIARVDCVATAVANCSPVAHVDVVGTLCWTSCELLPRDNAEHQVYEFRYWLREWRLRD